jgi:hypothetical protein
VTSLPGIARKAYAEALGAAVSELPAQPTPEPPHYDHTVRNCPRAPRLASRQCVETAWSQWQNSWPYGCSSSFLDS